MSKMDLRSTIESLRDFDTALLANTIGYIDPTPAHEYYMGGAIQSVTPSLGPSVGVAVICKIDSSSPNGTPRMDDFWQQLEQMRKMTVPVIWVVKTVGNRPDHECVLGDGMAKALYSVGCIATVTDGGVRDINGLLTIPFAAYCKGKTIHHCALRLTALTESISIGGITVSPGDILHANAGGVIKIPEKNLAELIPMAIRMRAFEHDAHALMHQTQVEPMAKQLAIRELLSRHGLLPRAIEDSMLSAADGHPRTSNRFNGQL